MVQVGARGSSAANPRNSHEQGIVQHIPEPRERKAERLREKKTSRRPGDVTLVMQDLKNLQQIDVSIMN